MSTELATLAETITKIIVALATVLGAAVLMGGLVRATATRLKPQVLVPDFEEGDGGVSLSGLSSVFRQMIRRTLADVREDASYSYLKTLKEDFAVGLLTVGTKLEIAPVTTALYRATTDSTAAVAAGIRAIAPKEFEGISALLTSVLPAQRGWTIRSVPLLRPEAAAMTVGLVLECADDNSQAPDAATTFWGTQSISSTGALEALRTGLHEVLEPAALWVAIRLVSQQLTRAGERGQPLIRSDRRTATRGLRALLTGQLCLYAMRKHEMHAASFASQALADLTTAAELLPGYFRPLYARAAVNERVGWAARKKGQDATAKRSFLSAVQAYDEAQVLLRQASPDATRIPLSSLRTRRTKCRLLSGDRAQVRLGVQELSEHTADAADNSVMMYNAACLWAVAVPFEEQPGPKPSQWESNSFRCLGRSLLRSGEGGVPLEHAAQDPELENLRPYLSHYLTELEKLGSQSDAISSTEVDQLADEALRTAIARHRRTESVTSRAILRARRLLSW